MNGVGEESDDEWEEVCLILYLVCNLLKLDKLITFVLQKFHVTKW